MADNSLPTTPERDLDLVTYEQVKEIRVVDTSDNSKTLAIDNLTIAGTKVTVAVDGLSGTVDGAFGDVLTAIAEKADTTQVEALDAEKLDIANVYNGLDKTVEGFALDARQGKALDDVDKANYAKSVEMIAHNAAAPTPIIPTGTTKTYEFSTAGTPSWLGIPVEVGDKFGVTYNGSSYSYSYYGKKSSSGFTDTNKVNSAIKELYIANPVSGSFYYIKSLMNSALYGYVVSIIAVDSVGNETVVLRRDSVSNGLFKFTSASGNAGEVGYCIIDWSKVDSGVTAEYRAIISTMAYDYKNSPQINYFILNSQKVRDIDLTSKFSTTINLWDPKHKDIFVGHLAGGLPTGTNSSYTTSGKISTKGKTYFRSNKALRFYGFYDENGNVLSYSDTETPLNTPIYTPLGATDFRFTVSNSYLSGLVIVSDSDLPAGNPEYKNKLRNYYNSELVQGNLYDASDADVAVGYTIGSDGALGGGGTSVYSTSGYIDVRYLRGKKLVCNDYMMQGRFRFICAFDRNKTAIPASYVSTMPYGYIVPMTISYIRVTYYTETASSLIIQAVETTDINLVYGYKNLWEKINKDKVYVFLPESVYVAVGRTIEIYNKQAVFCGNINNYHIFWNGVGTGMSRKWSYTGVTVGAYDLYLEVYDNNMVLVGKARTKIRVVAATMDTAKNVVYLGDSLSNNKPQNDEVKLLSGGKILSVGTLWGGYGTPTFEPTPDTLRHEGRSGWSPVDYLANSFYTYNNANAEGAVEVGGVWGQYNPFWNGSGFSLLHYCTTFSKTCDGIVLFLGTNDIDLYGGTYAGIVQMVQSIRAEYASLPIFVALPLFRGSQDGIGKQEGTDGYIDTVSWKLQEDWKVFRMQVQLTQALNDLADTNLHIIPISICHDSEYNFKNPAIETPVNPRSTITEIQDIEGTHPYIDGAGYLQFADIMFSTMVSKL